MKRRPHIPKAIRKEIYLRDDFRCRYCKTSFKEYLLTLDHVVPFSKGGDSSKSNLVTCCRSCNYRKADEIWGILWYLRYRWGKYCRRLVRFFGGTPKKKKSHPYMLLEDRWQTLYDEELPEKYRLDKWKGW